MVGGRLELSFFIYVLCLLAAGIEERVSGNACDKMITCSGHGSGGTRGRSSPPAGVLFV